MSEFKPHYTPKQMLFLGVFGNAYFEHATAEDLEGLGEASYLALVNKGPFNRVLNMYSVRAGQTFKQWQEAGWLFEEDPLGWFHWYCRYHAGRRHERDDHQIARWVAYGERWGAQAKWQKKTGSVSPVICQGLLQWGYDVDKQVLPA